MDSRGINLNDSMIIASRRNDDGSDSIWLRSTHVTLFMYHCVTSILSVLTATFRLETSTIHCRWTAINTFRHRSLTHRGPLIQQ
mmetsp:Transcript_59860/g.98814  ORF Transcript_59860/g.98814 Transcript_59860/m.98814 type:complete len:84 (+) Transcript_59860:65-316(+)